VVCAVNCTVDRCSCCLHSTSCRSDSQIFIENQHFCVPHLHSTQPLEGSQSECCHDVLTKSTCGASANTPLSSALALCYSAAEYCGPVLSRSAHTSQVDVQLNSTMHLISGTLRSTPLPRLPVLSNTEPPALQRKAAIEQLVEKIVKHDSWPIQPDILSPPLLRLTSRKPLWLDLQPVDIKS